MKHFFFLLIGLMTMIACTSSIKTNKDDKLNIDKNEEQVANTSFYQNKFLNGIDFFARGNEPNWTLEIDFENMVKFLTMYDINIITPAIDEVKVSDADTTSYHAQSKSGELIVTLIKEDCQDNMSGEPFNYKVKVEAKTPEDLNYKTFQGCGKFLYDYRLNDIWVMEEMAGVKLKKENLMKGLPTFEFNLKEMRFSGHAGCNRLMGKIEVEGSKIKFGNIASTLMACPDMQVEHAVIGAINKKTFIYKIENMNLTLENDSIKMIFKKVD